MKTTRRNIAPLLKDALKLGVFSSAILLSGLVMGQTRVGDPVPNQLHINPGTSLTPIKIDGKDDDADWANQTALPIAVKQANACNACSTAYPAANISGNVKVFWKNKGLYVFFTVTDDVVSQDQDKFKEGVEVVIDLDYTRGQGYDVDSDQIGMGFNGVEEPHNVATNYVTMKVLVVPGRGYNVEAEIRWPEEFYQPGGGNTIGIDFAINDTDGPNTPAPSTVRTAKLAWYASDNNEYQYVNLAGTATLDGMDVTGTMSPYVSSSKLFPNPSNAGQAYITMDMPTAQNVKITLSDLIGKQLAVITDATTSSLSTSFNTSSYPKGMYTVNYYIAGRPAGSKLFAIE